MYIIKAYKLKASMLSDTGIFLHLLFMLQYLPYQTTGKRPSEKCHFRFNERKVHLFISPFKLDSGGNQHILFQQNKDIINKKY